MILTKLEIIGTISETVSEFSQNISINKIILRKKIGAGRKHQQENNNLNKCYVLSNKQTHLDSAINSEKN